MHNRITATLLAVAIANGFHSLPLPGAKAQSRDQFLSAAKNPRPALLLTDDQAGTSEQIMRFENLIEGIGIQYEKKDVGSATDIDPSAYQLIVLSVQGSLHPFIRKNVSNLLDLSAKSGTNLLVIGSSICELDTRILESVFGAKPGDASCITTTKNREVASLNLNRQIQIQLYRESFVRLLPMTAIAKGRLTDGAVVYTEHQKHGSPQKSVLVSLPLMDYWKVEEESKSFLYRRPLFLANQVRRLMTEGYIGRHSSMHGKMGVFMLRWEDVAPVDNGRFSEQDYGHVSQIMMLSKSYKIPLNISIISRYISPTIEVDHGWSITTPENKFLRQAIVSALKAGGGLIVHGFSHQYGDEAGDITALDSEMSDDQGNIFRSLAEQEKVVKEAVRSFRKDWGIKPVIWETPHYQANQDTYAAAYKAGFRLINESDSLLFPHRHKIAIRPNSRLLNIPETATSFPDLYDDIYRELREQKMSLMPELYEIGAPYLFFFHIGSTPTMNALSRLLHETRKYDYWKPSIYEYAQFWQKREAVQVEYINGRVSNAISAAVSDGFPGLTLVVRLPDGTEPAETRINDVRVAPRARRIGDAWIVYPVITTSGRSIAQIGYRYTSN